jgi:RES domain-containing protein
MTAVPPPPSSITCNVMSLAAGEIVHRIHDTRFEATTFNPGFGDTRFAPIRTPDGNPIPACCAATSFGCAAFEYIFHDIDVTTDFKSVSMRRIEKLAYSRIEVRRKLRLARLFEPDLNKWGHSRRHLIDTPPSTYPSTRLWSAAIHASNPNIDGMIWTSRKYDEERALILFGDRVKPSDLAVRSSVHIASSPERLGKLRELGHRAGIVLTL